MLTLVVGNGNYIDSKTVEKLLSARYSVVILTLFRKIWA